MVLNPVEQRLVELRDLWQDFLEHPQRRLLLWQVPDNARRLVHSFFEAQRHEAPPETAYVTADTFVVFDAPFQNSIQYAAALKQTLHGEFEVSPDPSPDSARGWVESLNALADSLPDPDLLGAVLLPASVADVAAWQAWVQRALQASPAPQVRLVVLDSSDNPTLTDLQAGLQAHVQAIPIDTWDLARDTFAQEAAPGAAGVFRIVLAGLFGLVDKGDPEQVQAKANDALQFARRQGWADQEAVVRMLAASALLKAQRYDEALNHYQHARVAAQELASREHPASRQLVLQTWFGEAGTQLAAGRVPEAAACYAQAEPVAEDLGHPVLWIETLRMRAHCHAHLGETDEALACGLRGLQIGTRLRPSSRPMTSLPLLAQDLLKLTDRTLAERMLALRQELEQELAQLQRDTEQHAIALENDPEAGPALSALQQQQADRTQALVQQAVHQVEAVATSAADTSPFAAVYDHARSLLGPGWPLARTDRLDDAGAEA